MNEIDILGTMLADLMAAYPGTVFTLTDSDFTPAIEAETLVIGYVDGPAWDDVAKTLLPYMGRVESLDGNLCQRIWDDVYEPTYDGELYLHREYTQGARARFGWREREDFGDDFIAYVRVQSDMADTDLREMTRV